MLATGWPSGLEVSGGGQGVVSHAWLVLCGTCLIRRAWSPACRGRWPRCGSWCMIPGPGDG